MNILKVLGFNKPGKTTINTIIVDNTNVSTMEMVKTINKQYPVEVQQIHHEFHSAADNLLLEAKSIIEEARTKNVTKVNRLELLGFKQASQVTELKPLQQKAELSKEQLESLAYYQREYPFNKFITEEQVKIICHKYNLVCGDVSRFTGFVPEKNLSDIEKFKLNDKDMVGEVFYGGSWFTKEQMRRFFPESQYYDSHRKYRFRKLELQICAPVKDMDITGLELTEGYKLTKKHIPDPVVLQPVKNGYLIITAWGDEASDELVVNQINN